MTEHERMYLYYENLNKQNPRPDAVPKRTIYDYLNQLLILEEFLKRNPDQRKVYSDVNVHRKILLTRKEIENENLRKTGQNLLGYDIENEGWHYSNLGQEIFQQTGMVAYVSEI